ncbi:MAG TPA: PBP1A family penicillin-binding protein [Gemmatimonas aurantiaca]|uniref:peptidoglycan glycosyltransferase n=2 Tax=Gemmatimonas aurantiaca TaxID=173480 RepID=C1AAM8_GEMAT|nr:PBP1A family penicillin-binding protein [Gemmatimonas aurantiaca]BAH39826.1 penicillin-binding protein [Gemmatimonas aurantiaca T-27]HCT58163.1 PBP1A family penicillin-binding protein [Gemmatimonas aurantiaca]
MIRFRPGVRPSPLFTMLQVALTLGMAPALLAQAAGQGTPPTQAAAPVSTGEPWRIITPPQATLVLARDGALLGELGRERRVSISVRTLPKYVGQAFIAVEDKRFYQHDGVDLVGVAGALKDAVTKGNLRGASTITQLLVGNMHPDVIDRRDRSPTRKLREQQAAREMERHYSKEQILEAFLNQISFGRGAYGIEMAARQYFAKGAADLTLAEAASLASMPKSPVLYDPVRYAERNRVRRNTVLALMADQGYITAAQSQAAQKEPVRTVSTSRQQAPWVVDVVRVQAERAGVPVMQGGYRIHTTIDLALQRATQQSLTSGIEEIEGRQGFRGQRCRASADTTTKPGAKAPKVSACLEGAAVVLDPATGDVRALVGGRDYARSSFNRAVDGNRQPGSSFKAFVYAQAIAQGLTANATVADTALRVRLDNGQIYSPDNADNAFLGTLTLREALTRSRNPVAVQLALSVGMDSVTALARRAGLRAPIAPYPSSALGASVVQPLDFVAAYAAFDNGGVGVDPRFIVRVEDRTGRTVLSPTGAPTRPAMDPRVAFIMRDMMQDVVTRGTATALRRLVPARVPVAGKTGTTNDNTDVWFVGMTPELVTGVWLGFDKPAMIAPGAAGGTLAAPIAGHILASAYESRASSVWSPPPGVVAVELDRSTGQPTTANTPADQRYMEWFLEGTEPGALAWPWSLFRLGPIGN